MGYLCRFKNGEPFAGSVEWVHKVSLLSMLLGSLENKKMTCSGTIKSWRQKCYSRSACAT